MYKMHLWLGPGKDFWVKQFEPDDPYWQYDWCLVGSLNEGSELTIEWIQLNIGLIYEIENPERVEILQVREHSK